MRCETPSRQKGAVGGAEVEQVHRAAAMVEHRGMAPRSRRMVQHKVAFCESTGEECWFGTNGQRINKVGTAPDQKARRAGLRRPNTPVGPNKTHIGWTTHVGRRCWRWNWSWSWIGCRSWSSCTAAEHLRWVPALVREELVKPVW